ncbi:MAG: DUF4190 domain-containing protein [Lachnospiraceae bacterium]|nr:DUF4190 domain-containing protein [Lachnospiraceae bacterium]
MARYINNILLNKPADFVAFMMNDYLQKNGFSMADYKGTPAYRAGDPMLEGYKYIIWGYDGSMLHVEAWLRGPFGGEMDMTGFVAALQKKPFKESLEQLFYLMNQPLPNEQYGAAAYGQQAGTSYNQPAGAPGAAPYVQPGSYPASAPIPVQTVDNSGPAIWALVFGVLAVITGFFIPLLGILFGVLGVNRARLSIGSSKGGMAKIGQVLSIVGVAIAFGMWVMNIILIAIH